MNKWDEEFNRNNYEEGKKLLLEAVANRDPVAINEYISLATLKKYGFDNESPLEIEAAYSALCIVTGHENYVAKELVALYFYDRDDYESTYKYGNGMHTYMGSMLMGFLYESGDYVLKNRSKAYECYCTAYNMPDCPDVVRSQLEDPIRRTYIGSSHHASNAGRYIVKRLTIAVVGSLLILAFCAIASMM